MIGSVPKQHASTAHAILQNLFILNKSRGEHASGFSAIHIAHAGKLISEKRSINSLKFVDRCSKFKALRKVMPNIFIGHTRHATSGTPKRGRNNHPFNSDTYSMVHNGGVDDWKNIAVKNELKIRSETDSEVILRLVERKDTFHDGISHAMEIIPRASRVAVAMLRHVDEPKLFLFRNLYNPIYIMTYPRMHSIFFSSEGIHLEKALKSVFGDKTADIMEEHEINIEKVPEWRSLEFTLIDGLLPQLSNELEVHAPKIGFIPTKRDYISDAWSGDNQTYLPVVKGQNGVIELGPPLGTSFAEWSKKPIDEWNTSEMMRAVSIDTRDRGVALTRTIRESSPILESIRTNPFMSHDEIEHWKKWQLDV